MLPLFFFIIFSEYIRIYLPVFFIIFSEYIRIYLPVFHFVVYVQYKGILFRYSLHMDGDGRLRLI